MDQSFYDKDYYENGLQTWKSCYQFYQWMPEQTIPLAMTLIDKLGITKDHYILDYGCSKGFLVKAFRMLHRKAWGVDISEYALTHVPEEVKNYCYTTDKIDLMYFDFCIAKDVFEHMSMLDLLKLLSNLNANKLFAIIPLGNCGKYYAESNNMDKSHVICETDDWWKEFFHNLGWEIIDFSYTIDGIKESYRAIPKAHGFFTLLNIK